MSTLYKLFDIKTIEKRENGGRIRINTAGFDRDRDRVFPRGAKLENYFKNPVVQYGHNYRDPWATIGRTNELLVTDEYIEADFDLRPAANDNDPQSIVLLLWNGNWIKAASIGFMPEENKENVKNDAGGIDFWSWQLLEWSLVSIPSNQDALRQGLEKILNPKGEDDTEYNGQDDQPDVGAGSASDGDGEPITPEQQGAKEPDTNETPHDESEDVPQPVLEQLQNFVETLTEVFYHERSD